MQINIVCCDMGNEILVKRLKANCDYHMDTGSGKTFMYNIRYPTRSHVQANLRQKQKQSRVTHQGRTRKMCARPKKTKESTLTNLICFLRFVWFLASVVRQNYNTTFVSNIFLNQELLTETDGLER